MVAVNTPPYGMELNGTTQTCPLTRLKLQPLLRKTQTTLAAVDAAMRSGELGIGIVLWLGCCDRALLHGSGMRIVVRLAAHICIVSSSAAVWEHAVLLSLSVVTQHRV